MGVGEPAMVGDFAANLVQKSRHSTLGAQCSLAPIKKTGFSHRQPKPLDNLTDEWLDKQRRACANISLNG